MVSGICTLTGTSGQLVRSHIIPDTFMRRATMAPFMQSNGLDKPKKAFTGWYDANLVTAEGEGILSGYDSAAAGCFHSARLTYKTRRIPISLELEGTGLIAPGVREIPVKDITKIRLFALSLLWRAAATQLDDFSQVSIRPIALEKLRRMVADGDGSDPEVFAAYFGVFDDAEELPKIAPSYVSVFGSRFLRVFLDGVVCYVSVTARSRATEKLGRLVVGREKSLLMLVLDSRGSWHSEMSNWMMRTTFENYGDPFRGFAGLERFRA